MMGSILSLSAVGNGMTATLNEFRYTVLFSSGKLAAVTNVGISLAAFCVCISMIIVVKDYMSESTVQWWSILRPVIIFLFVCNFGMLVVRPLDSACGVYNGRLSKAVGGSMTEFQQVFREASDAIAEEAQRMFEEKAEEVETSDKGWFQKKAELIGLSVKKWVTKQTGAAKTTMASVVLGLVFIIFKIMCAVMVIMATLYLTVLSLLGPFTFALSVLPPYKNGIKLWIERYIQYSLWVPLTHIACYLCTSLAKIDLAVTLGGSSLNGVSNMGYCFTAMLLLVMSFKIIRQIPGLASYIIESGSHETLSRDMLSGGGGLSRLAGKLLTKK